MNKHISSNNFPKLGPITCKKVDINQKRFSDLFLNKFHRKLFTQGTQESKKNTSSKNLTFYDNDLAQKKKSEIKYECKNNLVEKKKHLPKIPKPSKIGSANSAK